MKHTLSLLAASIIAATSAQAETTGQYSWEDGATIFGGFRNDHLVHSQSNEQARTGNFSLKIEDADAADNSTTQSYIGWVNGLTDGDTVTASIWVYDDADTRPAGRVWGHYTDDANDSSSFAGSAGGNSTYTSGTGWQELTHTWTFDSSGGSRDGLMVQFRVFDDSDNPTGSLYVDDLTITSSTGSITFVDGTVIQPDDGGDDGNGGNAPLVCGDDATAINAIQGSDEASPLDGTDVIVEAIVTADFQESLSGIYLQTATGEDDGDAATSEGIFVFTGNTPLELSVGDRVRIAATAGEFRGMTQLSSVTAMEVCASDVVLPATSAMNLPFDAQPEALEGMLVSFEGLTANSVFQLGRFGNVTLSNGRRFNPTQVAAPGDDALAVEAANDLNSVVLDDGSNEQNPEFVPYPAGGLSAGNTLRVGDTLSMSQGVLAYAFGAYRIHPTSEVTIENTNPRIDAPALTGESNVKVASFNVLNYFTTLDERGADDEVEFQRQQAKTVAALTGLDADVIGLMEMENNGFGADSAIANLVAALNAADADMDWQYVSADLEQVGTDAITNAIIYRGVNVTPVNAMAILDSSNSATDDEGNPLFLDTKNRPTVAQEFSVNTTEETFVVAVNHFKSKGSDCDDVNDPNTGDGQGNCNLTRTRAAQAVSSWLASEFADKGVLLIGDLNAYAMENPLTALADGGYTELFSHLEKDNAYSYVFGGESGQLDHALANAELLDSVVDATEWHINTDEPVSLDYNTNFKSDTQIANYYAPDAYRSSDHDPMVVSLNLLPPVPPVVTATTFFVAENTETGTVIGQLEATDPTPDTAPLAGFALLESSSAAITVSESGEVVVADSSLLDYDAGLTEVTLLVVAFNSEGLQSEPVEITVTVTNLADEISEQPEPLPIKIFDGGGSVNPLLALMIGLMAGFRRFTKK